MQTEANSVPAASKPDASTVHASDTMQAHADTCVVSTGYCYYYLLKNIYTLASRFWKAHAVLHFAIVAQNSWLANCCWLFDWSWPICMLAGLTGLSLPCFVGSEGRLDFTLCLCGSSMQNFHISHCHFFRSAGTSGNFPFCYRLLLHQVICLVV